MISVIVPTYNRASTIKKSLDSVLNQTFRDLELIVIDDGSTDNTKDIIDSYTDTRIKYVYQKNAGACVARNLGINCANGELIAFQDSDDFWHPKKLEKQISAMSNSGADIVFCKMAQFEDGKCVENLPQNAQEGFLKPVRNLFGIGTQTLLIKKIVFDDFLFDPMLPRFQELEFLLRATQKRSIYCLDESLVDYEINIDSISSNSQKLLAGCELILKKHPYLKEKYPEMLHTMSYRLCLEAKELYLKNDNSYREFLNRAVEIDNCWQNKLRILLNDLGLYRLLVKYRV